MWVGTIFHHVTEYCGNLIDHVYPIAGDFNTAQWVNAPV